MNNYIVNNEKYKVVNNINNYFTGITNHLNLKPDQTNNSVNTNLTNIIENFKNHKSIQRLKRANFNLRQTFIFL